MAYDPNTHMHEGWSYEDEDHLQNVLSGLRESHPVTQLEAFHDPQTDSIHLDRVVVHPSAREQGIGTSIMRHLAGFADSKGKTLTLQTADRGAFGGNQGTTSANRLKSFYKRFGFKESKKPRSYRPDLKGNMHRDPKERHFYDTLDELDRFTEYRSAAIYSPRTGQIFEGPMHLMAHDAAHAAGHPDAHAPRLWEDGFMTHDGQFHDREGRESVDMMSKGQLPLAPKGAGDRPDIRPEKAAQLRAIRLRGEGLERHSLYRSAAVRSPNTGKVYEGTWHGDARSLASGSEGEIGYPEWEDGFVTHGGDFHDRDQADAEAKRVNELASKSGMHMGETVALMGAGELDNLKNDEGFSIAARGFRKFLEGTERHSIYRSASIRNSSTGKMFEGTWHGDARNKAIEAGVDPGLLSFWQDGFTTHEGEFHDRDRAHQETVNASLRAGKAWSSGLNEMGMPESVNMMMAGHLPMDKSLTREPGVDEDLRKQLESHLEADKHFYDHFDEIERFSLYRSAAIRHPKTKEVFEGAIHAFAREDAFDAMGDKALKVPWVDGFVTHDGEFHTRREAARQTKKRAEAIALHVSGHLDNEELNDLIEQDPQILKDHGFRPSSED
jgi:GNAT superfamily N-acetyltransferase